MIDQLASVRAAFLSQRDASSKSASLLSDFDPGDPRGLQRLSLEQQKKRAKELLQKWRATPPDAVVTPQLSDAQHAIANEYGFRRWADLKTHILAVQAASHAISNGEPTALDSDQRVLHIRCGNDIRTAMAIAGFTGDFLVFADPYVHGPVPHTTTQDEFIRIRTSYVCAAFDLQFDQMIDRMNEEYADLESARDYDAVYLWFEHDSYDQLIVAKLLDFFSDPVKRPAYVKMINVTHFPGVERFNGIGHLPPEALRVLWHNFVDVTAAQYECGQCVWDAVRSSTPVALRNLIKSGTPALPTMAPALDRHLKQLPSRANGLNLTENLALQILHDKGDMTAARLFGWYTNHYEPLTFMGDTNFWNVLHDLSTPEQSAILMKKEGDRPPQWHVSLTDLGHNLLNQSIDWLALNPIDYWVGGIHVNTREGRIHRAEEET